MRFRSLTTATIADRLQLFEELVDSIPADADARAPPLTEAERVLIEEHLPHVNANPAAGWLGVVVRAGILGKHRR